MSYQIRRWLGFVAVVGVMASLPAGVSFGAVAATVTLTSSANLAVFGQPVTLTAAVSSAASGLVTFYDGVTVLGIRTVTGGQAALTTSLLSSGTHLLHAYYGGSASYTASVSASITLTVNALPANGFQLVANPGSSSGTVNGPASMAVGDFNGDGKADVAVANSKSGNVSVLLGSGDGAFRPAVDYPLGGSPNSVVAGDFNGDGYTDLAVGNGQTVSVLLGNGDGTFQAPAQYAASAGLQSLAVGDFNGDGIADLVVASAITAGFEVGQPVPLGGVIILLGNGDGTFQPQVSISGAGGNAVVVGDFNGDGKADLAVVSAGLYCNMVGICDGFAPGGLSILLGNGDGTFRAQVTYPNVNGDSVVTGDFNGDGKTDLAIGVAGTSAELIFFGDVDVLLGNGDGTFQPGVIYPTIEGTGDSSIVTGDFNGDGKPDLAVVAVGVTMLFGKGDGTFPTTAEYSANQTVIAVGSFNGDGRTDLAGTTGNGVNALLGAMTSVPSINAGGIVNAASLKSGPVAPGSIATAFGTFSISSASAPGTPLPTSLAGLSIQFGSVFTAPLFSVSANQVNFQVPWGVYIGLPISAMLNSQLGPDQAIGIAEVAPGIFSTNGQGTGQGAILDAAYVLVDAANPATAGASIVQIYCTGLGPVTHQPADGAAALSNPLSTALYPPTVSIGGATATVLFSGLTPGAVGLDQVNALVPAGSSKGAAVPVVISIYGAASNIVTMAVQ